jgi:hypothetical protein
MQEKSIRATLDQMFSRFHYVGIQNILDTDFEWTVALEKNAIIGTSEADSTSDANMAARVGGSFTAKPIPTTGKTRITRITIKKGQRRMLSGEAAYVIVPRLFTAYVREKYVTPYQGQPIRVKAGLAKLRSPSVQKEVLSKILIGPIVKDVEEAMELFVSEKLQDMDKLVEVKTSDPKKVEVKASDPDPVEVKVNDNAKGNK